MKTRHPEATNMMLKVYLFKLSHVHPAAEDNLNI